MLIMRIFLPALALVACSTPDYGLSTTQDADWESDALHWTSVPVSSASSATEAATEVSTGLHRESFEVGPDATTALQDYLFVIDDSASMRKLRDPINAGLQSLWSGDVFPDRSRIAVMYMTPADPNRPKRPHPLGRRTKELRNNPGFVKLVNHEGIRVWTQGQRDGCAEWFAPDATTASGDPCFAAHTELSYGRYRVEDGLVALAQLLERRGADRLFRQGASVNVIFVSDTQPPGYVPAPDAEKRWRAFDDLESRRPDWPALQALVAKHHTLAALRVHAIAPETTCSENWEGLETLYQEMAVASGGVVADSCETSDFAAVVLAIQETGSALQQPLLVLGSQDAEILSVTIDDVSVPWTSDGTLVTLEAEDLAGSATVQVIYQASRPKTRGLQAGDLPPLGTRADRPD
jgi:hypothetical protein